MGNFCLIVTQHIMQKLISQDPQEGSFQTLQHGMAQEINKNCLISEISQKKNPVFGWTICGNCGPKLHLLINLREPKMMHPSYSGLTLRIFNKFCTMKEAMRYMPII